MIANNQVTKYLPEDCVLYKLYEEKVNDLQSTMEGVFLTLCGADLSNGFTSSDVNEYKRDFPMVYEFVFDYDNSEIVKKGYEFWSGRAAEDIPENVSEVILKGGRIVKCDSIWFEELRWFNTFWVRDVVGYKLKNIREYKLSSFRDIFPELPCQGDVVRYGRLNFVIHGLDFEEDKLYVEKFFED